MNRRLPAWAAALLPLAAAWQRPVRNWNATIKYFVHKFNGFAPWLDWGRRPRRRVLGGC